MNTAPTFFQTAGKEDKQHWKLCAAGSQISFQGGIE
jgi:hypothetical protein